MLEPVSRQSREMPSRLRYRMTRLFRERPMNRIGAEHAAHQMRRLLRPMEADCYDIGFIVGVHDDIYTVGRFELRDTARRHELDVVADGSQEQEIRLASNPLD